MEREEKRGKRVENRIDEFTKRVKRNRVNVHRIEMIVKIQNDKIFGAGCLLCCA